MSGDPAFNVDFSGSDEPRTIEMGAWPHAIQQLVLPLWVVGTDHTKIALGTCFHVGRAAGRGILLTARHNIDGHLEKLVSEGVVAKGASLLTAVVAPTPDQSDIVTARGIQ